MRVKDILASATCAKMTEEKSKNGGPELEVASGRKKSLGPSNANGAKSPNLTSSLNSDGPHSGTGGSLKFFMDGKFILELSHRKDGERTSWVSVPKKTYWPPSANCSARQESSASLSVSDDNSSVQSSPWQRDHCWKQTSPQRGISRELSFVMKPVQNIHNIRKLYHYSHNLRKKRRRPYDTGSLPLCENDKYLCKVKVEKREDMYLCKVKVEKRELKQPKLTEVVKKLWDRISEAEGASVSSSLQNSVKTEVKCSFANACGGKMDPNIISPRKRILREMEKVSLEDFGSSKRHKPRCSALVECSTSTNNFSMCQTQSVSPRSSAKGDKLNSNYSINSLLGKGPSADDGETKPSFLRTLLKSPNRPSSRGEPVPVPSSSGTSVPVSASFSPDSKARGASKSNSKKTPPRHASSSSVTHLACSSPGLGLSPDARSTRTSVPSISNSRLSPFLSPVLNSPLANSANLFTPIPFLPHHPSLNNPFYSNLHAISSPFRSSTSPISPLWVHNPLPSLPREEAALRALYPGLGPPCQPSLNPWSQLTPRPIEDLKKEDGNPDVPLNLSKNAG